MFVLGRKCQTIKLLSNNAKVALNNILLALRWGNHSAKYEDGSLKPIIRSSDEGSYIYIYEIGEKKIIQKTNIVNKTKQAHNGFGDSLGSLTGLGLAFGGKMINFSKGFDKGLRYKPVDQIISAYQEAVEYLLSDKGYNNCIRNFICSGKCDFDWNRPENIKLEIENSKESDNEDIEKINNDLKTFATKVKNEP